MKDKVVVNEQVEDEEKEEDEEEEESEEKEKDGDWRQHRKTETDRRMTRKEHCVIKRKQEEWGRVRETPSQLNDT